MPISTTDNVEKTPEEKGKVMYSRTNPYHAKVLKNVNLNGEGSDKETHHLELSLGDSNLTYEPGDVVGIYPENDPELVGLIIEEMKWNPDEEVTINKEGEKLPLKEALTKHFEITLLSRKILQNAANFTNNEKLASLVKPENAEQLKEYTDGRDLLDMLRDFGPWNASAQEIISLLRKIPPRLYSIASSLSMHQGEVHLTIGAVRYHAHGRERKGVCSVYIAERVKEGDTVPIFIQQNKHFHLPDRDKDIIMVGPGTGIAPFRSFIEERKATNAKGKAWLFFGDQHAKTDYLYGDEFEQYKKEGVLTKISLAFSRDQEQKVYVQHKMLENSKELFEWLENGAYFYVCGDKQRMAKDVHETLVEIISKEGQMTREKAEEYLKEMQKEKRYQRDVY